MDLQQVMSQSLIENGHKEVSKSAAKVDMAVQVYLMEVDNNPEEDLTVEFFVESVLDITILGGN